MRVENNRIKIYENNLLNKKGDGRYMKKIYAVAIGLFGSLFSALIYFIMEAYIGFSVIGLKMIYVVPIGAFAMGYGSTFVFYKVAKKMELHYKLWMDISAGVIAFISFILIYFGLYSITYITEDYNINYFFEGDHISSFQMEGTNKRIDFLEYMKIDITSRENTAFFGDSGAVIPLSSAKATGDINWVFFVLEWAAYIFGSVMMISELRGDDLCEDCGRYIRAKKISVFKEDDFAEMLDEEEDLQSELVKIAKVNGKLPLVCFSNHVRIEARYCPCCFKGKLLARHMTFDGYKFQESLIRRTTVETDSQTVMQLI